MKIIFFLLLTSGILCSPSMAVDTSNWINVTSNAGFTFQMPSYWASDPMGQTTEVIRTDKSDAVLLISYEPFNSTDSHISDEEMKRHIQKEMANVKVNKVDTFEVENNNITASGKTLVGTIITAREEFLDAHVRRWICEFTDENAVTKYNSTLDAIINSTRFN
jgi:hypothetical protein